MQPTYLIVENEMIYDAIIIGGGPSGATAAMELALQNRKVAFIDREGRIKPCGGAIPPRPIRDFNIPDSQIVAKIKTARMISPTSRMVDIPIENGYVGMVERENFDEFLRNRASNKGAKRFTGTFLRVERTAKSCYGNHGKIIIPPNLCDTNKISFPAKTTVIVIGCLILSS